LSSGNVEVFSVIDRSDAECSHKIFNLCYDPETRVFVGEFASPLICRLALKTLKLRDLQLNFNLVSSILQFDRTMYPSMFERLVNVVLMKGGEYR
jgi:hypothetical protein